MGLGEYVVDTEAAGSEDEIAVGQVLGIGGETIARGLLGEPGDGIHDCGVFQVLAGPSEADPAHAKEAKFSGRVWARPTSAMMPSTNGPNARTASSMAIVP